jgi:hypothetical protein
MPSVLVFPVPAPVCRTRWWPAWKASTAWACSSVGVRNEGSVKEREEIEAVRSFAARRGERKTVTALVVEILDRLIDDSRGKLTIAANQSELREQLARLQIYAFDADGSERLGFFPPQAD